MMQIRQLITNSDNRLSTTATIQFLGFLVLAATLLYSVALGNHDTSDLYLYFAGYCGGLTASKGVVTAYQSRRHNQFDKANKANKDGEV